jgi:hypothetical protein
MNDRKQALEALRDKVKAGADAPFCEMTDDQINQFASREMILVQSAYHGSLDAAKALHDAVLPGWHFNVATEANRQGFYATVIPKQWGKSFVACSENPARAWLLAILNALIEQENNDM